ncbi:MAG TPA: AIR synthase-related protein [Oligoflexia bacterium]|nr:AIR synthase-related protein [Oligoflexia bacterium]HMP47229.1 AIR synthase-related protein [Oligoflexia bacterium]
MSNPPKSSLQYNALGASAGKEKLHAVLEELGALPDKSKNFFCQVSNDVAGSADHFSVMHCDGAGTKTIIPYLWYKETGSREFFGRLAADALVMNLDDVYCLGKPEQMLLANAIARNASLIPEEVIKEIIGSYIYLGTKLRSLGVPIEISGGETADCGDTVRTLVVDATLFSRIKKKYVLDPANISPGDVIVSLASFGRSTYENTDNSGIGSNGLTLARHALLKKDLLDRYPEIGNPLLDLAHCYQGPFSVTDEPGDLMMNIGDALSSPTRTYAPVLECIFRELPKDKIRAAIHLTGGAHSKVLRFCPDNTLIIKDDLFNPPPIFNLIQEHGQVETKEMYKVFNMGTRMEIYCDESISDNIIQISERFNIAAKKTGYVEKRTTSKHSEKETREVLVKASGQELSYVL